ncbi:hypothetical protein C7B62_23760, partial [Pleurocapsa sp. CCALA 161]|uniref:hypothetical protein n=1 Tax=Pleurocapsa sp. CCALA 161 TaxID=2107688 RepID=UPI000D451747
CFFFLFQNSKFKFFLTLLGKKNALRHTNDHLRKGGITKKRTTGKKNNQRMVLLVLGWGRFFSAVCSWWLVFAVFLFLSGFGSVFVCLFVL